MTIGYIVLSKRPSYRVPGTFDYAPAGSVQPTREPCENHQAYCEAQAKSGADRFGNVVEYVIGRIEFDD